MTARLREALAPDRVEIGGPRVYVESDDDDTASWADVRQLVAGVKWLVKGWVPYGMLTGLIAEPKVGKSAFALGALAAPLLTGGGWFTGAPGPGAGPVVWCDTEGSAGINVQRAVSWGVPLDRVKVPFPDDPLKPVSLDDPAHLDRLLSVVCRYRAKLLVVDSFRGAHGGDENNSRIAGVLQRLANVAEQTKAAVALIHHTRKIGDGEEVTANSGRGSNAFLAMVRVQLAIDRPDPSGEWRRVRVLGENLGAAPEPVGFRFGAGGLEFGPAPERPRRLSEKDGAEEWLRGRMAPGEVYRSADLLAEAKENGHAERTVRKAATEKLGVRPRPVREGGHIVGWEWVLPVPGKEISSGPGKRRPLGR